ncbi:hypothetical protein FFLO_00425 [Filobasidium floriforme]|uniref:Maf-like protein n=1 Tax=Filobasidium floriforme TaxID=5210 RepID=A0A8K0JT49_9TREE|nr:hypothetical protein FFLO_00425 [Filobasidium floriforme]
MSSSSTRPSPVLEHALNLPIFKFLKDKRVVLASSSPRRKELLDLSGLKPEIIPSEFPENLPKSMFAHALAEYPIATVSSHALEVYERLVKADDRDAPDLVIGADTVIIFPPQSKDPDSRTALEPVEESKVFEKPFDKDDHLRMLQDLNGKTCEIVTGVTIVYPTLGAPGYKLQSISVSTIAHFRENTDAELKAYVEHGEGIDRAGGFAIQGAGGFLVKSVEGDWNNVVGFPVWEFWHWLGDLLEDDVFNE